MKHRKQELPVVLLLGAVVLAVTGAILLPPPGTNASTDVSQRPQPGQRRTDPEECQRCGSLTRSDYAR